MFFRLLHITCGLMIVLLGVKVYDLVEYVGAEVPAGSSLVASAVAQPSVTPASAEASTHKADAAAPMEKNPHLPQRRRSLLLPIYARRAAVKAHLRHLREWWQQKPLTRL